MQHKQISIVFSLFLAAFLLANPFTANAQIIKLPDTKELGKKGKKLIGQGEELVTTRAAEAVAVSNVRALTVADSTYTVTLSSDKPANTADEFTAVYTSGTLFIGARFKREVRKEKAAGKKKEESVAYIAFGFEVFKSKPSAAQLSAIALDMEDASGHFQELSKKGGETAFQIDGKGRYGLTFADLAAEKAAAEKAAAEAAARRAKPTTVPATKPANERAKPAPAVTGMLNPATVTEFVVTYTNQQTRTFKGIVSSSDGTIWTLVSGGDSFKMQVPTSETVKFGSSANMVDGTLHYISSGKWGAKLKDGRLITFTTK